MGHRDSFLGTAEAAENAGELLASPASLRFNYLEEGGRRVSNRGAPILIVTS